jgi:hypothetical protein
MILSRDVESFREESALPRKQPQSWELSRNR